MSGHLHATREAGSIALVLSNPAGADAEPVPATIFRADLNGVRLNHLSRIRHDIQHEVATIVMLAEAIRSTVDNGTDGRLRVQQLVSEVHWLDELLRVHNDATGRHSCSEQPPAVRPVRVDLIADEVVGALRMTSTAHVEQRMTRAYILADTLALWRALRNVIQNAFRATGPNGQVAVTVRGDDGEVVIQIDDDGPGFGRGATGLARLGLGIVHDFAVGVGGLLEIDDSELGGSCVRLILPAVNQDVGNASEVRARSS